MIDIQLDWATAATILGTVTSFAAFMYGVFKPKKKTAEEENECADNKEKTEGRFDKLESNVTQLTEKLEAVKRDIADLKEERKSENREYLDKLSRIEDRIGKMLDLIINLNSRNNN